MRELVERLSDREAPTSDPARTELGCGGCKDLVLICTCCSRLLAEAMPRLWFLIESDRALFATEIQVVACALTWRRGSMGVGVTGCVSEICSNQCVAF
jgi:hypothetical protein